MIKLHLLFLDLLLIGLSAEAAGGGVEDGTWWDNNKSPGDIFLPGGCTGARTPACWVFIWVVMAVLCVRDCNAPD